jgi:hypothetical protein
MPMKTLKSKINFFEELKGLIDSAQNEISIFSPYIKTGALTNLLDESSKSVNVAIITTWKPADLALGYSDLKLYPFCEKRNIPLLLNKNIHLKAIIIDNMKSAYIGSGNITNAGLAIGNRFNYELGVINDDLSLDDKIYFDKIISEAEPVDDEYYQKVKQRVEELDKPKFDEEFDIDLTQKKDFLLSSLPMSNNVDEFYDHYSRPDNDHGSEEDIRSAEHDRRLYQIPRGLNKTEFDKLLIQNFLRHPFIFEYLNFIGDGKYFGELSAWLHDKVTTVPTPRRYDIKKTQNRVNSFILHLSDEYAEEIPGRKSVRFFRTQT